MGLEANIAGFTSGNKAEVDVNNNMKVTLPQVYDQSGYARMLSEVDAGLGDGTAFLLPPEVSEDFRFRTELDTILDDHNFIETAQFTGKHIYRNTTMTNTWSGNGLTTNGSSITTTNTGTLLQTYQLFPIYNGAQTYVYLKLRWQGTWAVTNSNIDTGLFNAPTATPYAPTDGCYIRVNSAGVQGVSNYNGSEQVTAVFKNSSGTTFVPTIGTEYDIIITIGSGVTVFWLDDRSGNGYFQPCGRLISPATNGRPCQSSYLPFSQRHAIGTAASAVLQQVLVQYTVIQGGFNRTLPWEIISAASGNGHQGGQGMTQGGLALLANNQAIGAGAAMTNTTAALGTGLGGVFTALPTLTSGTFGILDSYQVPAQAAGVPGRQLIIRGVKISAIVGTGLTGGPVVYHYHLAFGHNALSLATAEAATTKKPRFEFLGQHAFAAAAAAGTTGGTDVYMPFHAPIVVNPGEYVQVVANNIGSVPSAGTIIFGVTFDYCWMM